MLVTQRSGGFRFFCYYARCTIHVVQSAVLRLYVVRPSVRPSVCLSVCNVAGSGWKSWRLIAWIISPTPSLFLAQRPSTYSRGNIGKFWGLEVGGKSGMLEHKSGNISETRIEEKFTMEGL